MAYYSEASRQFQKLPTCDVDNQKKPRLVFRPAGFANVKADWGDRAICYTENSMPLIQFRKNRAALTVESGANLMQALLAAGLPVASSCRGDGVCGKCRIQIVEGHASLSKESALELYLHERHGLEPSERVSCQTQVLGNITIDTTYW
jgi:2Fe-2S ferredoxin